MPSPSENIAIITKNLEIVYVTHNFLNQKFTNFSEYKFCVLKENGNAFPYMIGKEGSGDNEKRYAIFHSLPNCWVKFSIVDTHTVAISELDITEKDNYTELNFTPITSTKTLDEFVNIARTNKSFNEKYNYYNPLNNELKFQTMRPNAHHQRTRKKNKLT